MATADTTQAVPYSAGNAFITLIRKADGTPVDPPQAMMVEGIQDINWDDKGTIKELHGDGAYAARVAGGKNSLSLSLTIAEVSGKHLNALCYGRDVENRQLKIRKDRDGVAVPELNSATVKIGNSIQLNLARCDGNTSVSIDGVAASVGSGAKLSSGQYKFTAGGLYHFAEDDVGKALVITYVSRGTTLESTLKVPKKLTFNLAQHTRTSDVLRGTVTTMTRKPFNWVSVPANNEYMASQNGVVVFNDAQAGVMTITHNTDGIVNVKTKVAVLPAAAYGMYLDPAAASVWTANEFVLLKADSGAAMSGVLPGETLTEQAVLAGLASGQYMVDSKGFYLFHSADTGDTVEINYTTDYQSVAVTPPDEGEFVRDLGVRTRGGIALTRVALTSPLSLLHNQYAVADNGTYYFDKTNGGDTLYINYQYQVAGGQTIVVDNGKIGEAPTLMLDVMYELDGEMISVAFERVKPKGTGIATKQEDFAGMKFEFMAFANRESGVVYTLSTSA